MARIRDWIDLGKATLTSVTSHDVSDFYSLEWPETRRMLTADHRASIDGERRRIHRFVRTLSAMMYGLARRLAPHRRLLFLLAQVWFFFCLFALFGRMKQPPVGIFLEVAGTFLLITLLLAMELMDKIKYRDELELARDLQANLIPKHPPATRAWDIAAFNHIANTVGGDIYDFVVLGDERIAVLFGDASGHGMAAGLVMAVAHASFRTQLDLDPSPQAIMASLNRILCRTGGTRSFFSCCYLLLDPTGGFVLTLAGHPPVLKADRQGQIVEHLGAGAYPLGIKLGLRWEELSGSLQPGERLVLHSDGLTEARDRDDRELGDSYVETIVGWHPEATAALTVESLAHEWRQFIGRRAPEDDVSIAVIARR